MFVMSTSTSELEINNEVIVYGIESTRGFIYRILNFFFFLIFFNEGRDGDDRDVCD